MTLQEQLLELLRTDHQFRERVRQMLLGEELQPLLRGLEELTKAVQELLTIQQRHAALLEQNTRQIAALTEAQQRNEKQIAALVEAQQRNERQIAALVEAQRQMQETLRQHSAQIAALVEAQQRNEKQIAALVEAQQQMQETLRQHSAQIAALVEAQQRNEKQIAALEEAQQRNERQIAALVEAQRRTEEQVAALVEAQRRTEERIAVLAEDQGRMREILRRQSELIASLVKWQRGEAGRREGERYERRIVRRAIAIFGGGRGGAPDSPHVQERLLEWLGPVYRRTVLPPTQDPSEADLIWWKDDEVAVVEVSLQVNGEDVQRAAERAATLRQVGVPAMGVVIGEKWANKRALKEAERLKVEWFIGTEMSEGFLRFRQKPTQ